MPDDDLRAEIADLEDRIEHLAVSLHRSRKMLVAAKAALWLGAAWIAARLLHLVSFDPLPVLIATTAVIGGIVLLGSTTTSARQTAGEIHELETRRARLIGDIELRVVGSSSHATSRRET